MSKCETIRNKVNIDVAEHEIQYYENALVAVHSIIGDPSLPTNKYLQHKNKRFVNGVLEMHFKLRDRLVNTIMNNGRDSNYTFSPYDMMSMMPDWIQHKIGTIPAGEDISDIVTSEARRLRSIISQTNSLLNARESVIKAGKLPRHQAAFMPIALFGMKHDRFGLLSKFTRMITKLTEESYSAASFYVARTEENQAAIMNVIDNIFGESKLVTEEHLMSRPVTVNIKRSRLGMRSNQPAEYLGSVLKDDNIYHQILKEDGSIELLPEHMLSHAETKAALAERILEFADEVINNEVKKVKWVDKITDSDNLKTLAQIVNKIRQKKKLLGIKQIPELHTVQIGNILFNYVFLDMPGTNEKTGVIIGHKDLTSGKAISYYESKSYKGRGRRPSLLWYDKRNAKKHIKPSEVDLYFKDGFWRADYYGSYGEILNRRMYPIRDSVERAPTNFTYMKIQPPESIIEGLNPEQKTTVYSPAFWQYVDGMKALFDLAFSQAKTLALSARNINNAAVKGFVRALKKKFSNTDELNEALDSITTYVGISTGMWYDRKTKVINTPDSIFNKKLSYAPWMFEKDVTWDMLSDTIESIEARIETVDMTDVELDKAEVEYDTLKTLLRRISSSREEDIESMPPEERNKLIIATKTAMTKHRSSWSDPMRRRRDSKVYTDYFNHLFASMHKNLVLAEMFNTISNFAKLSVPDETTGKKKAGDFFSSGHIDYIINITKKALRVPSVKNAYPIIDKVGVALARGLTSVSNAMFNDDREFSIHDVDKMVQLMRGLNSMAFLGYRGAMGNRTQTINDFIRMGFDMLKSARYEYNNHKEMWDAVIHNTGVDQLLSAFYEAVSPTDDINLRDAGLIVNPIPMLNKVLPRIPTNAFIDWMKMKREERINNGNKDVDKLLSAIEDTRLSKILDRERGRVTSSSDRRSIEALRKAFVRLLETPPTSENYDLIKEQFRTLMGDVSERRFKRMLSFKLSWWYGQRGRDFGRAWFTFTEGEKRMRALTAVMNILYADKLGLLGSSDKIGSVEIEDEESGVTRLINVPARYLSKATVRIARNGVNYTMYNMSREAMGLAFAGFGSSILQYKEYQLQQTISDFQVIDSFLRGGKWYEAVPRMLKETGKMLTPMTKYKYNPNSDKFDHQAVAMIRFLMTRGVMSAISAAIELVPFAKALMYKMDFSRRAVGQLRDGENPVMRIMMRWIILSILYSTLDDDEADKTVVRTIWESIRGFLPIFISYPLFLVTALRKSLFDE